MLTEYSKAVKGSKKRYIKEIILYFISITISLMQKVLELERFGRNGDEISLLSINFLTLCIIRNIYCNLARMRKKKY